MKVIKLKLLN